MSIALIDSHFHAMTMQEFGLDLQAALAEAEAGGLHWAMDIAVHIKDFDKRKEIFQSRPNYAMSLGLYPSVVEEDWKPLIPQLRSILERESGTRFAAALGECGIDQNWDFDRQSELFREQILLANEFKLPVVVHNRGADEAILKVYAGSAPNAGIMHCFSSGRDSARKFLDQGLYLSFAGNLSYKKNETLREVLRWMPKDRLLLETDAPVLPPQPVRGKPNQPSYLRYTYETAAQVLGISMSELGQLVLENARRLFPFVPEG